MLGDFIVISKTEETTLDLYRQYAIKLMFQSHYSGNLKYST